MRRYLGVQALDDANMPADTIIYRAEDVNAQSAAGYGRLLVNLFGHSVLVERLLSSKTARSAT